MREILPLLRSTSLFTGLTEEETESLLSALHGEMRAFDREELLLRAGQPVRAFGVLLSGGALVRQEDFWGNRNLLAAVGPGELFAEAFACAHAVSPVSVQCTTDGSVLYLNVRAVFSPCEKACAQHKTLSQNLIRVLAEKNMQLNEKAGFLSQRTTREKLLAYLSAQARRTGSASFRIPFDRQHLPDLRPAQAPEQCTIGQNVRFIHNLNLLCLKNNIHFFFSILYYDQKVK